MTLRHNWILPFLICAIAISSSHGFISDPTFDISTKIKFVGKPLTGTTRLNPMRPNARNNMGPLHQSNNNNDDGISMDRQRRTMWTKSAIQASSVVLATTAFALLTRPVWAAPSKSRTNGYAVQQSEDAWKRQLSPMQYFVLREGGTERPYYSILESEKRPGVFQCVACGTPLFASRDKFHSGTGWPSFARALDGVEVEQVDPITANLSGAELRCKTCGGHLGDVFRDGFLFIGTEAAKTNRRYCIDGAALVFQPEDGSESLRGDIPAKGTRS
jgi:peptide-methionine (R)-S-oxide reductase